MVLLCSSFKKDDPDNTIILILKKLRTIQPPKSNIQLPTITYRHDCVG